MPSVRLLPFRTTLRRCPRLLRDSVFIRRDFPRQAHQCLHRRRSCIIIPHISFVTRHPRAAPSVPPVEFSSFASFYVEVAVGLSRAVDPAAASCLASRSKPGVDIGLAALMTLDSGPLKSSRLRDRSPEREEERTRRNRSRRGRGPKSEVCGNFESFLSFFCIGGLQVLSSQQHEFHVTSTRLRRGNDL